MGMMGVRVLRVSAIDTISFSGLPWVRMSIQSEGKDGLSPFPTVREKGASRQASFRSQDWWKTTSMCWYLPERELPIAPGYSTPVIAPLPKGNRYFTCFSRLPTSPAGIDEGMKRKPFLARRELRSNPCISCGLPFICSVKLSH